MSTSTSKSEGIVLSRKRDKLLHQVREFKYLRVSNETAEPEVGQTIGAGQAELASLAEKNRSGYQTT